MSRRVVLDTNVFVAAGFNARSRSAEVLSRVGRGELELVWNEATRRETAHILRKIPPLEWQHFEDLFEEPSRYDGPCDVDAFDHIPDRDDRKFAALASAWDAVLVTMDDHLLDARGEGGLRVETPDELLQLVRREERP